MRVWKSPTRKADISKMLVLTVRLNDALELIDRFHVNYSL